MFNMPTSGPLSPIVSLERRKLEQQGIPPGQEQPGSAAKGSPISGDLAQLIQLNRMLQQQGTMQQQANAAPSTVAQDLMQRAGQQMQPQMQQMPPQMDPRQQGVAQLPQEVVGNGMAAGGIVAFDDGGSVRHFDGIDGSLVGSMLDLNPENVPDDGNLFTAVLRKKALEEMAAKQQAARTAPSDKGQGLRDLVRTLSAPKEATKEAPSESDILLNKMRAEAAKNPEWYAAQRKKMEEESGLAGIWKKQQEEQDRLKAQNNPAARNKAFWDNLSEQLAGQIGQRGVPLSSRLAQMVGAYGTARSATNKETKKLEAELNKAANDLQEKQAMYRMTGSMADRKAVEQAQKDYLTAAKDAETATAKARSDALVERRLDQQGNRDAQRLRLDEAKEKRDAEYQKVMADVALGRAPQAELKALATSLNDQLKDISRLIVADPMPDEKAQLNRERTDIAQQLKDIQSHIKQSLGINATAPAPTGGIRPIPLADYLKQKS